jgi:hypothetical protein
MRPIERAAVKNVPRPTKPRLDCFLNLYCSLRLLLVREAWEDVVGRPHRDRHRSRVPRRRQHLWTRQKNSSSRSPSSSDRRTNTSNCILADSQTAQVVRRALVLRCAWLKGGLARDTSFITSTCRFCFENGSFRIPSSELLTY